MSGSVRSCFFDSSGTGAAARSPRSWYPSATSHGRPRWRLQLREELERAGEGLLCRAGVGRRDRNRAGRTATSTARADCGEMTGQCAEYRSTRRGGEARRSAISHLCRTGPRECRGERVDRSRRGAAGLPAHGDTAEEAIRGLDAANRGVDRRRAGEGRDVPIPGRQGAKRSSHARMPRSLHAELSRAAEREKVSLNQFIASSLEGALRSSAVATREVSEDNSGARRTVPACSVSRSSST